MKTLPISVVINTKNSAPSLEMTLKSVTWSDDIVVCDMGSTDKTLEIAKSFTSRIFITEDVGYVEPARNFAISKAKHEWVLVVDADEEVPKSLVAELPSLITGDFDVYDLPRKNIIFGKWMKFSGYWPDHNTRLFRKSFVTWSNEIHQAPQIKGRFKLLPPVEQYALIHHHYQTIEQYIDRLNRYTSIEAKKHLKEGTSQVKVIEQGFSQLFTRYFKDQGYKEDLHGLSVTFLQMFYQITTQLKVWQAQNFPQSSQSLNQIFPNIISQMKYWYADYRSKTTKNPLAKFYWLMRKHFRI